MYKDHQETNAKVKFIVSHAVCTGSFL